jgi:hypothetical protein
LGERWLKTDINDVRKKRGTSMTATIKTSIRLHREPNSTLAQFPDEDLFSISAARIRDEFRKLSRFLPITLRQPLIAAG